MAKKAGDLYKGLYLGGYAMTNLHIHATLTSAVYLEDTDKQTAKTIRERTAYTNIGNAFALFYLVLEEQNQLFKLGLEQTSKQRSKLSHENGSKKKRPREQRH